MPCEQIQYQVRPESSLGALALVADFGRLTNKTPDSFNSMCLILVPEWNVAKSKKKKYWHGNVEGMDMCKHLEIAREHKIKT